MKLAARFGAGLLLRDLVSAHPIGALEGFDGEAHLLSEAAGDEAADAMILMPTSA